MAAKDKAPLVEPPRTIAELEADLERRTAERDEALARESAIAEASTTSPRSGHARPLPSPVKPMARPVWTPTDAQRRQAETMAAYGIPEADIARVLGVSKPTLRKHCGTELDTSATRANSKVADFLFYGICGGTGKPAFKNGASRARNSVNSSA
jgi:hypothetical protein